MVFNPPSYTRTLTSLHQPHSRQRVGISVMLVMITSKKPSYSILSTYGVK